MTIITNLKEVLLNIEQEPWDHSIYVYSGDDEWSEDTACMILDADECDESDDSHPLVVKHNLKYLMGVSTAQDVVVNIRNQGKTPTLALNIKALKYYYEKDAFIAL